MTDYVLGFRFRSNDHHGTEVALIEKVKPAWQAGKLNGIGGRVEVADVDNCVQLRYGTPAQFAMAREFREEAGLLTMPTVWRQFGELRHDDNLIYLLTSVGPGEISTMEKEKVAWFQVGLLGMLGAMPNLRWMIPMALDKDKVSAVITDPSKIKVLEAV